MNNEQCIIKIWNHNLDHQTFNPLIILSILSAIIPSFVTHGRIYNCFWIKIAILTLLLLELVYNYHLSVWESVSELQNLLTTTPPKRLDGLSWNFQEIFPKVSSSWAFEESFNLSGRYTALWWPPLVHNTYSHISFCWQSWPINIPCLSVSPSVTKIKISWDHNSS